MKNCPKCQSINEESYDLCWKCQYNFTGNEIDLTTNILLDKPIFQDDIKSDSERELSLKEPVFNAEIEDISKTDSSAVEPAFKAENEIISKIASSVYCPNCNTELVSSYVFCPNCQYQLKKRSIYTDLSNEEGGLKIKCLRCKEAMYFRGTFKFHEGSNMETYRNQSEIFTNRECFDLYFCHRCRKVEFFFPQEKNLP
jgi:hypothetical protein